MSRIGSLRLRLAATFALVALLTGLAVAVTAPSIIGRGFARLAAEEGSDGSAGSGSVVGGMGGAGGFGRGPGAGPGAGLHAAQVQADMTETIVLVALVAAAAASILGFFIAGRIAAPLGRLEDAAEAVAGGDLARRSGLADRSDEIGALGRSFDAMAAELESAEAGRQRFFQDVAHELKTPLAVIESTASAVLDGVYPHDETHLETIRGQSRILARIVDDLRTISLAESGHLPLRLEPLSASDVAEATVRSFAARAEVAGIHLELIRRDAGLVHADRDRLAQIVAALVDNAVRHTPIGGTVTVSTDRGPGTIRLAVDDTGPGLSPEDAAHVFDRFYQVDPARDRSSGTSGLGLAIVSALATAQGGRAMVDPAPERGARFVVELPGA